MARLVFLGRLEEVAGAVELKFPLTGLTPLDNVLQMLPSRLAEALGGPKVRIAVNGSIVEKERLLVADGDEVSFLPSVSGG
ncbi:MAG: MoaD/ThiS family protein [Rhodospirillales bacterium]|nr:MoaD/ThiS family protein [Rhodospirillales bacterium]